MRKKTGKATQISGTGTNGARCGSPLVRAQPSILAYRPRKVHCMRTRILYPSIQTSSVLRSACRAWTHVERRSRFCVRSARAKRSRGWVADFGSPLEECPMRSARGKRATERKRPGGWRPSKNYRRWLRHSCQRDWVLATRSTHRSYTISWSEQTRYWTISRRGSEVERTTPNHPSASFPSVRYDFLIVHAPSLPITSLTGTQR